MGRSEAIADTGSDGKHQKWCSCKWNKFESDHQAEVSAAFDAAIVHEEEREVFWKSVPIHSVMYMSISATSNIRKPFL